MKTIKKSIAVLMAVLLSLSCTALFVGAKEAPLNYVVLGDSIAYGSGIYNSNDACYARIVANTNGYNYVNYAVNGYTTSNLIRLLDRDSVISDVQAADIISISIGGNDFLQQNLPVLIGRAAIGDYKILDDIGVNLAANFATIIDTIKELNPNVTIIVQTLYNPRTDLLKNIYGLAVDRVNAGIFSYLEQNPSAFELVDVRSVFDGHPEYVALDSIHPSAEGNIQIAKILLNKLCELGLGDKTEPVIKTIGIDQVPFSSQILTFIKEFFAKIKTMFNSIFA